MNVPNAFMSGTVNHVTFLPPPPRGEGRGGGPTRQKTNQGQGQKMPFTPDMRRKVDQIRDYLYGGGYPDPLSNAEQLSFLFFFYMIEGIDAANLR